MARPKKNGTYLNVGIKSSIYERLEELCEDAGQTKTVAVERALTTYLENYEENQRKIEAFYTNNDSGWICAKSNFNQKNEQSLGELLKKRIGKSRNNNRFSLEKRKYFSEGSRVNIQKSSATTRRYMKLLVETGHVIQEGSANNIVYKNILH